MLPDTRVLDKGYIQLRNFRGNDKDIVNVARVTYRGKTTNQEPLNDKDKSLLKRLWNNGHTSPFRHQTISFTIKAPLFVIEQLKTHKVGVAWNEASQRYKRSIEEFYIPEHFRKQSDHDKQATYDHELVKDQNQALDAYIQSQKDSYRVYKDLLYQGVCREQARAVLPTSLYSTFVATFSLQSLIHLVTLRADKHAQKETREYAYALKYNYLAPLFPETFKIVFEDEMDIKEQ
jgi:thymidylate synthase (FAD)